MKIFKSFKVTINDKDVAGAGDTDEGASDASIENPDARFAVKKKLGPGQVSAGVSLKIGDHEQAPDPEKLTRAKKKADIVVFSLILLGVCVFVFWRMHGH